MPRAVPAALKQLSSKYRHLSLVAVLLAMVALILPGIGDMSPTSDEWAHFTRGVAWWTTGDTRLSYAHPPLANVVATIPVAIDGALADITQFKAYPPASIIPLYDEYFSTDYSRARDQLVMARHMMIVFPIMLVAYAYWLTLSFFGWRAAILAAGLIAFNPTVLAHGRLVTTDLPAALGYLLAVGEFARYLTGSGSWSSVVRLGLAASWAILSKHNGLLLIPAFVGIGLITAARARGHFEALSSRKLRFKRLGLHVLLVTAIMVLAVNAAYRFQRTFWSADAVLSHPEPQYWITRGYEHEMLERWTPLEHLPSATPLPLPYTYVFGVVCMAAQNARGWPRPYFMGTQGDRHGTWSYFPTLLLIKNPLSISLLVLFGTVMIGRRRFKMSLPAAVLAAMLAYFVLMILRSNLNMGVRHAAPAIPLMSILGSLAFWQFWERTFTEDSWPRTKRTALIALVASTPLAAIVACPNYLGYFNVTVGRELGHEISIIGEDWGQDFVLLDRFVRENDLSPLFIGEHTRVNRAELEWLGLSYRNLSCEEGPPPSSWAVMRAAVVKTHKYGCHVWTDQLEPTYVLNNHIYIYRTPAEDWPYAPKPTEEELAAQAEERKRKKKAKRRRRKAARARKKAKAEARGKASETN